MAQVVKCLPSKHEAWNSNPITTTGGVIIATDMDEASKKFWKPE
jgi:hypothetical protein